MKLLSLAVCLVFAASVSAQEPFVKDYGPRASVADAWKPNGVFHGNKRVPILVKDAFGGDQVYFQPFDFLVPAGDRYNHPRGIWYPIKINYWTDGRPWVQTWRFVNEVEGTYTLITYPVP